MPKFLKALIIVAFALVVLMIAFGPNKSSKVVIAPSSALNAANPAEQNASSASPAPLVAQVLPATPQVGGGSSTNPSLPTISATELSANLDVYLREISNAGWFQGSVLVARGNEVILSKGYGMADASKSLANAPDTRYRIASLSKQFTAVAIMVLYAEGRIDVHESICYYLKPCPSTWTNITIHHLLTHSSGLPNYTDFDSYTPTQMIPTTPQEIVSRFSSMPLLFEPGTSYMYENSDYVLLGLIIEQVSGRSYADYMRQVLFEPLGMYNTSADPNFAVTKGYHTVGVEAAPLHVSTLFGAGSISSTVEDLYRWDQALYGTYVLPSLYLNTMWTRHYNNYGYGWMIGEINGMRTISHPGLIDGFSGAIMRVPDAQVTVIVLSNMDAADPYSIATYIAGQVLER